LRGESNRVLSATVYRRR